MFKISCLATIAALSSAISIEKKNQGPTISIQPVRTLAEVEADKDRRPDLKDDEAARDRRPDLKDEEAEQDRRPRDQNVLAEVEGWGSFKKSFSDAGSKASRDLANALTLAEVEATEDTIPSDLEEA